MTIKIELERGEMMVVFRAFQIAHPPINDDGSVSPTIPLADYEKQQIENVADRIAKQTFGGD